MLINVGNVVEVMTWVLRNGVGGMPWYVELVRVVDVGIGMVILLIAWVLRNVVGVAPW